MLSVIGQPKLQYNIGLLPIASMSRPACFKTACWWFVPFKQADEIFVTPWLLSCGLLVTAFLPFVYE
jgi:hypothetical protein